MTTRRATRHTDALLKYGAVPLFSLVATQFPGIGDTLFAWFEPALRALK